MISRLLHQYSWNSEVETTWINLICWPHRTSSTALRKVCVRKVRGKNWCKNWRKNMTSLQSRALCGLFVSRQKEFFHTKISCSRSHQQNYDLSNIFDPRFWSFWQRKIKIPSAKLRKYAKRRIQSFLLFFSPLKFKIWGGKISKKD